MGIKFSHKGDFGKTTRFLNKIQNRDYRNILEKFGQMGVNALAEATPKDTGLTADSWYYEIIQNESTISVHWNNSHVNKGVNIALILQYGHGTGTGGYVKGVDYINPALKPIFEAMADAAWKEVTNTV